MKSTVKALLLSALLGVTSAGLLKVAPGPDCWYKDRYCETTGVAPITLTDAAKDDTEECYELCEADASCVEFTVRTTGARPAQCYLLAAACVENKVDDCIAQGKCVSGPSDCTSFDGDSNCALLPALDPEYVIWQCTDANLDTFNPYTDESPPGTICKQVCPAWTMVDDGSLAQLTSTCQSDGTWSPTDSNGALTFPDLINGETNYPGPDATDATALTCGCPALPIKWDPTPLEIDTDDTFFYDPNAEDAAEFICTDDIAKTDVDGNPIVGEFELTTGNTCVLYCDEHYVATASCVDGQWTGNPEWGFWCYEEPTE